MILLGIFGAQQNNFSEHNNDLGAWAILGLTLDTIGDLAELENLLFIVINYLDIECCAISSFILLLRTVICSRKLCLRLAHGVT